MISRVFFLVLLVVQAFLLSKFVADHENAYGYFGLAGFLIPLLFWCGTLYYDGLKYRLGAVWLLYSCILVIMIGVIFGRAVIEDDKLREHEIATCLCTPNFNNATTTEDSFFDSKFLKITLCFTPGLMLLLLTSVKDEDEILKQLYLTTVMDLFDGIEMVEVLHEDVCDKIPMGWEIAVLIAALLFFLTSALELHQVKFTNPAKISNPEKKKAKKTKSESQNAQKQPYRKRVVKVNVFFQVLLNLAFFVIRAVLWFRYDFNSAVFLAKNVISLVVVLVDILEVRGYITTESRSSDVSATARPAKSEENAAFGDPDLSQNF